MHNMTTEQLIGKTLNYTQAYAPHYRHTHTLCEQSFENVVQFMQRV